jgi:dTDP-4-dehydrorhamnose 3,5-epimerase-like enzyme
MSQATAKTSPPPEIAASKVKGVRLFHLPRFHDHRGSLAVGEFDIAIPFRPVRYFMTFDVPEANIRGEHAHRVCQQFLICVTGSCSVLVDDGAQREEFRLDDPALGIYVPPMVWAAEFNHSTDSRLLVFASHHYDPDDYIRDYPEFLAAVKD